MNKKEATVNYYVVRIYRKETAAGAQAAELTGLVETQTGAKYTFHDVQELWRILGGHPEHDRRPRVIKD